MAASVLNKSLFDPHYAPGRQRRFYLAVLIERSKASSTLRHFFTPKPGSACAEAGYRI